MAKKKEALTLEEKLQTALVPDWEQPYQVPSNWVWVRGNFIFKPMENIKPQGTSFTYIDIDAIDNINQTITFPKVVTTANAPSRATRKLATGDVLFSLVRPYLKNIAYIGEEFSNAIASTGFYVCKSQNILHSKYTFYLMCSGYVVDGLNMYMKGDNSPSIRVEDIKNYPFPLPPLAEQERIVSKIENLFSKLDQAKELAHNALDSFESRKSALLHQAFTGELTKKWREENGVSFDSWEEKNLEDDSILITKGASPKWQGIDYTEDTTQTMFITSENVREGYLDLTKKKFLDDRINEKQKRSILQQGDVLLNIVGASIGRSAIFDIDRRANINQAVSLIRVKETIMAQFLCLFLNSPQSQAFYSETKVDVARANISLSDIKKMIINLPTLPEQKEIVRILDSLFEKEKQAKELANVISQVDLMKKAILGRAFRG